MMILLHRISVTKRCHPQAVRVATNNYYYRSSTGNSTTTTTRHHAISTYASSILLDGNHNNNNDNNNTTTTHDNINNVRSNPIINQQQQLQQQLKLQSKRYFSDSLLGYNPMSQNKAINKNPPKKSNNNNDDDKSTSDKPKGAIVGVDSNTEGGGVWAQTSAKRDKLGELKMEIKFQLGQRTLDDLATDEERYDLFLMDGVSSVAKMVDCGGSISNNESEFVGLKAFNLKNDTMDNKTTTDTTDDHFWNGVQTLMNDFEQSLSSTTSNDDSNKEEIEITKEQFEQHLNVLIQYVQEIKRQHPAALKSNDDNEQPEPTSGIDTNDTMLSSSSSSSSSPSALLHIRDFLLYEPPNPNEPIPSKLCDKMQQPMSDPFLQCYDYFQITLLQTALEHLLTQWDDLTKISSADIDRAATRGETMATIQTLNLSKIHLALKAFASGSNAERVEALWNVMDKDDDGMLDQEEMDKVVYMTLKPVEDAVKMFISDCMDVWPMRKWGLPPPCLEVGSEDGLELENIQNKKLGFYKRWKVERHEKKSKRLVMKLLDKTIKTHFDIEAETPHRLRCIYAWAEKEHQGGNTESVLVDSSNDESAVSGVLGNARKRYVELDPKITYAEFKEVQADHFPHLDNIAQELCTSLKEDLWVHQGKGRQNQELKREMLGFFAVVSLIDYAIIMN